MDRVAFSTYAHDSMKCRVHHRLHSACVRALVSWGKASGVGARFDRRRRARLFVRRHRHDASTLRRTLVVATRNAAVLFALLQREAHAGCAEGPMFVTFGESRLFPNGLPTAFTPTIADLDSNGLLDLVVRAEPAAGTSFAFYRNGGTPGEPVFSLVTGSQNPFEGLPGAIAGEVTAPQFVDLDADGDLDLVAADPSNTPADLLYFENTGGPSSPRFLERTGAASPFALPVATTDPSPAFGDLDTDGDLDLVIGRVDGSLGFYENTGSAIAPAFIERAGPSNPLRLLSTASRSTPVLSDLEGDGDLDLVSGSGDGTFSYFENTGTAVAPAFMARTGESDPFRGIDLGEDSHPTLGDLDADGDPDLLASQASGRLAYYVDDPSNLRNLEGVLDPSHSSDPLHWGKPTLADFDGDEDLDLLTHSYQAGIWRLDHYENTGTKSCPSFIVRTGGTNPFAPLAVHFGPMAFGDLDLDGDLDVVVGKGTFESFGYFENTGGTEAPAFVERTGSANPCRTTSSTPRSTPQRSSISIRTETSTSF
ncbi:MAG: VCBS repeat-containing protein [Deltaproteobacteria bacterium]|nr:VCBS repeat-containing protein [Deltaproteobacteria bacterium]